MTCLIRNRAEKAFLNPALLVIFGDKDLCRTIFLTVVISIGIFSLAKNANLNKCKSYRPSVWYNKLPSCLWYTYTHTDVTLAGYRMEVGDIHHTADEPSWLLPMTSCSHPGRCICLVVEAPLKYYSACQHTLCPTHFSSV